MAQPNTPNSNAVDPALQAEAKARADALCDHLMHYLAVHKDIGERSLRINDRMAGIASDSVYVELANGLSNRFSAKMSESIMVFMDDVPKVGAAISGFEAAGAFDKNPGMVIQELKVYQDRYEAHMSKIQVAIEEHEKRIEGLLFLD